MATIATITGSGSVFAVNADGVQRALKAGDVLQKGESIRTTGDAQVELLMDDGRMMHVNPDQVVKIDDNVFQTEQTPTAADSALTTPATAATVIQALNDNTDLTTTLDATAAGGGDGGGGGGNTFVQLTRIAEGVNGNDYNYSFAGLGVPDVNPGDGLAVAAAATVAPTINLVPNSLVEDQVTAGTVAGKYTVVDPDSTVLTVVFKGTSNSDGYYQLDLQGNVTLTQKGADFVNAGHQLPAIDLVVSDGTQTGEALGTPAVQLVNDAPVAVNDSATGAAGDLLTTAEDTKLVIQAATLLKNDTDEEGDTLTIQSVQGAVHGAVVLNADGTITFTPDANYNGSGGSFTYTVSDGNGGTATATVAVNVTSVNDVPTFSTGAGNDSGAVTEDASNPQLSTTGTLVVTDVDANESGINPNAAVVASAGALGSLSINAAGAWTYSVDNNLVQNLAQGETKTEVFTVKSVDGTSHDITITLNGTNDNPTITAGTQSAPMIEAGVSNEGGTPSATIQLTLGDIDSGDTARYDATQMAEHGWIASGGVYTHSGTYGMASLDTATGVVTYNLLNGNAATNALADGAPAQDPFTVYVKDDTTGTNNIAINFAITGSNDNPTVTAGTQSALVIEAGVSNEGGTSSANIQLTMGDTDNGDTSHYDTAKLEANGWFASGGVYTHSGTYGMASLDTETGVVTYNLLNSNAATDALAEGAQAHDDFTVYVKDDTTGANSTLVSFAISGTNDAPVIRGEAQSGSVTEGSATPATGTMVSDDVDLGHTAAFTSTGPVTGQIPFFDGPPDSGPSERSFFVQEGPATSPYGTFSVNQSTGVWEYQLNNSEAVQALVNGDIRTETYTVTVTDDKGATDTQNVVITINGSSQTPVISGTATGGVTEDNYQEESNLITAQGDLTATQPNGGTLAWSVEGSSEGQYGTFSVGSGGQWTYTLNNGSNGESGAVQSLAKDEQHDETFTVKVDDGLGGSTTQTVTVTVTGTNDAPTIRLANEGSDHGSVKEDDTLTASGQLTAADIDHHATATWSIDGSSSGTYGSIAVDDQGKWTYTLNNDANVVQALPLGASHDETFNVLVTDDKGDTASQQITVTVTGTNDVPTITGDISGSVKEDTTASDTHNLVANGKLVIADADTNQSWLVDQTGTHGSGSYGTFSLTSDGSWTYTADNTQAAIQHLGDTGTLTDSFTAVSADGTASQLVTVTIHGTNDNPTLTVNEFSSGGVYESGLPAGSQAGVTSLITSGNFSVNDVEGDTLTASAQGASYGSVAVTQDSETGQWTWTYTLNAAVHNAANSASASDTFTLTVDDGHGGTKSQQITVNIWDDAPVAQGTDAILHTFQNETDSEHANNGWGNGDQEAPGNSGSHNNAENAGGGDNSGDTSETEHDASPAFAAISASGTLVTMGADVGYANSSAHAHIDWSTTLNQVPEGLQSNGHDVVYGVVGNVLTASTNLEDPAATVFTMTANADGTYQFDQKAALDRTLKIGGEGTDDDSSDHQVVSGNHEGNNGNNGEDGEDGSNGTTQWDGNLSFHFSATDADGDTTGDQVVSITLADTFGTQTAHASDVYQWQLADPEQVTLLHFDVSNVANKGGDVLDLRDLLSGEHSSGLENYLHFSNVTTTNGPGVQISVDHDGTAVGTFTTDHTITLGGMSLSGLQQAVGAAPDGHDLIAKLIDTGHLKTDV